MGFEPLGNLLGKHLAAKPDLRGPMMAARVVAAAEQELAAAFPALAKRVQAVSFREGVVTMRAATGAAAAELRLREPVYLAGLRKRIGPAVRALRYQL